MNYSIDVEKVAESFSFYIQLLLYCCMETIVSIINVQNRAILDKYCC